jgi:hypothetical protein
MLLSMSTRRKVRPAGVLGPSTVTAHAQAAWLLRADSTTTISLAFISKLGTLEVAAASLATSTYWVGACHPFCLCTWNLNAW